jgi:hypothetical protein
LLSISFDEALLLLRGVVFRVLLEIAVRPGLGDRADHSRAIYALQLFQLRL